MDDEDWSDERLAKLLDEAIEELMAKKISAKSPSKRETSSPKSPSKRETASSQKSPSKRETASSQKSPPKRETASSQKSPPKRKTASSTSPSKRKPPLKKLKDDDRIALNNEIREIIFSFLRNHSDTL